MTSIPRIISAALVSLAGALLAPQTAAAQQTYFTFDAFVASIGSAGIDTFDDDELDEYVGPGPLNRNAGAFTYTVQAGPEPLEGLFVFANPADADDNWLSTEEAVAPLVFGGFSSNVFAIGGRFFATDIFGNVLAAPLKIEALDVLGNAFAMNITPTATDAFFGLRFDAALRSFTITADNSAFVGEAYFPTVNDLVLGSARAVPEPASVWLMLLGAGGLGVVALRRRAPR